MRIHHVGYLVDEIEKAAEEFAVLGFSPAGEVVEDASRGVKILFIENNGYRVELIQPISPASPVYGLRKRHRNSPYHICYETDSLKNEIDRLSGIAMLLREPEPAPAIPGCPEVAFLMSNHVGMIELVEVKKGEQRDDN